MKKKLLGIVFTLVAILATVSGGSEEIQIKEIKEKIKEIGITREIDSLFNEPSKWGQVLAGISRADSSWISIGLVLKDSADAGASETLTLALGEALERSPSKVFEQVRSRDLLSGICGAPDVDNPKYDSYELSLEAIEKRTKMVKAVKKRKYSETRIKCIEELENSKKGIQRFYKK